MNALPPNLSRFELPLDAPETMRVETTTLLPGGSLATLSVTRTGQSYTVSDDGEGRMALLALGLHDFTDGYTQRGKEIADASGLAFDDGRFELRDISSDRVPAAVVYVADACRSWVASAVEARAFRSKRGMIERTIDRLHETLPGLRIDRDRELLGASSKRHRFDVVVTSRDGRFAVFETVAQPTTASLAALHLKFYDLMQAVSSWPREAVIGDLGMWPAEDLALVQQVATHVRSFDSSWNDLRALAA